MKPCLVVHSALYNRYEAYDGQGLLIGTMSCCTVSEHNLTPDNYALFVSLLRYRDYEQQPLNSRFARSVLGRISEQII